MSNGILIFCYCFAAYGLCNMMCFASGPFRLFEHIRNIADKISEHFGEMFRCMMCLPTHFGWIVSLVNKLCIPVAITPFNIILGSLSGAWYNVLLIICLDAIFTSGIVWFIHNVESLFEKKADSITFENLINDGTDDK